MKKLLIAGATLTALIGTPALAADMALKAPPPAAPVSTWSGCYIGLHGGVAFGRSPTMSWMDVNPGPGSGAIQYDPINFGRSSTSDGIGGAQLGCNWQVSPSYVLGLEGDASWTRLSNSASVNTLSAGGVPFGAGSVAMTEKTDFLGSVRGRAGFLWSGALFYATGGVAWAHENFTGMESYPNPAFTSATSFSKTPTGWVAGAGVETMIKANWLLRAEFLYYGFNGTTSTVPVVPFIALHPANIYGYGSNNIGVVRVGLSYKFN
jgi:outer membrane immunogenic protein